MAEKKTSQFSAEEKALMKQRAKELKENLSKEQSLTEVLAAFKKMNVQDREIAEKLHSLVATKAPQLWAKTWYSMPAYANAEGKVILFFQESGKFKVRYSTIGFSENAKLDEGSMWATSFAVLKWSGAVEKQVAALISQATS